jgi:DNA-binding response OmpR family regulator
VVDDDENIRLLYSEELAEDGYKVLLAGSGEEALEKLRGEKVDLVTLDIKMPGMDGLELLKRIMEVNRTLPIILSTAYGTYKQDFASWGSDEYVVKSSDLSELKSKIKKLINPSSS